MTDRAAIRMTKKDNYMVLRERVIRLHFFLTGVVVGAILMVVLS